MGLFLRIKWICFHLSALPATTYMNACACIYLIVHIWLFADWVTWNARGCLDWHPNPPSQFIGVDHSVGKCLDGSQLFGMPQRAQPSSSTSRWFYANDWRVVGERRLRQFIGVPTLWQGNYWQKPNRPQISEITTWTLDHLEGLIYLLISVKKN